MNVNDNLSCKNCQYITVEYALVVTTIENKYRLYHPKVYY